MRMRLGLSLIAVFAFAFCSAAQSSSTNSGLKWVVGLSAENGSYALSADVLTARSSGTISVLETPDGNQKVQDKDGATFSVRVTGTHWERSGTKPTSGTVNFSRPFLCDPLNQIDVADDDIRKALPSGARVKSVAMFSGGVALAIYSNSDATIRYGIHAALLEKRAKLYAVKQDTKVSEYGFYCGLHLAGSDGMHVLVDEPAASSDYLALYVYQLRH